MAASKPLRSLLLLTGLVSSAVHAAPTLLDCDRDDWLELPVVIDTHPGEVVSTAAIRLACQALPAAAGLSSCDDESCCPLGGQAVGQIGKQIRVVHSSSNADGLLRRLEGGDIFVVTSSSVPRETLCGAIGRLPVADPPSPEFPETAVCSGPATPSRASDPVFEFFDPTGVAVNFECARDESEWSACTSPESWGLPLGPGPEIHRLSVRGIAPGGIDPTPAEWRWVHVEDLLFAESFEAPPACP